MKKYLYYDTETTGVPKRGKYPIKDSKEFPRITQLAWCLVDENFRVLESRVAHIKPNGWTIPKDKFFIENGMSTELCEEVGNRIEQELRLFIEAMDKSDGVVAHNVEFDSKIVMADIIESNLGSVQGDIIVKFQTKPKYCTMKNFVSFVDAKFKDGRSGKFPSLQETHVKLFNKGFKGSHDAMNDVKALMRCHWGYKRDGVADSIEALRLNDKNWY